MATPEFITQLRSKIGHERLWMAGVKVVVFDRDRVLLVRRADNGRWTLPAGIVDPGEEPGHAAWREVLEETGVEVEVTHLIGVGITPETQYPNGDRAHYVDIVFRAEHRSGTECVNDDENIEVGYFGLQAYPALPPLHERALRWALDPKAGGYFSVAG